MFILNVHSKHLAQFTIGEGSSITPTTVNKEYTHELIFSFIWKIHLCVSHMAGKTIYNYHGKLFLFEFRG